MIASCQLMRKKPHNNSCEIHTDEKDVQSNNALIHKESNEPWKLSIRFSKSSTKEGKSREMKDQNSINSINSIQSQTKEKSVIILGDSIVKHLNGYQISRKLSSTCKVYVRNFPGAKTRCMTIWSHRCVKTPTTLFLIWIPNDLQNLLLNRLPIFNLTKKREHDVSISNIIVVSISNIIVRTDNQELKEKALTVKKELPEICRERSLYFIDNLTHFSPVSHFYTPWKRQKTFGFLTFSEGLAFLGGIEMWHWNKMD